MDMNETQSKALERGLNDATALSQDEWRGVALAMMAQCQPWYEELERLRAAAELVQVALENNHMAMVVLVYGRELGLWK